MVFSVTATRTSSFVYVLKMNGRSVAVEYRELRNGTLLLKYKDRSHPCYLEEETERYKVHIGRMQVCNSYSFKRTALSFTERETTAFLFSNYEVMKNLNLTISDNFR